MKSEWKQHQRSYYASTPDDPESDSDWLRDGQRKLMIKFDWFEFWRNCGRLRLMKTLLAMTPRDFTPQWKRWGAQWTSERWNLWLMDWSIGQITLKGCYWRPNLEEIYLVYGRLVYGIEVFIWADKSDRAAFYWSGTLPAKLIDNPHFWNKPLGGLLFGSITKS